MKISLLFFFWIISFSVSYSQEYNLANPSELKEYIEVVKKSTEGPEIGSRFPDLTAFEFDGKKLSYEDLQEKLIVVNIWYVGCTGCKQEEPFLKKLTDEFSTTENVIFLNFSMSSPKKNERYFSKRGDFGYQTASVERSWVKEKLNITLSPTHFPIKNGVLEEKISLALAQPESLNWFKSRILSLLN